MKKILKLLSLCMLFVFTTINLVSCSDLSTDSNKTPTVDAEAGGQTPSQSDKDNQKTEVETFVPKTFTTVDDVKEFFESAEYANKCFLKKDTYYVLNDGHDVVYFYNEFLYVINEKKLTVEKSFVIQTYSDLITVKDFGYENVNIENISKDYYKIKLISDDVIYIAELDFANNYIKFIQPNLTTEMKIVNEIEKIQEFKENLGWFKTLNFIGPSLNEIEDEKFLIVVLNDFFDKTKIEQFIKFGKDTNTKVYFIDASEYDEEEIRINISEYNSKYNCEYFFFENGRITFNDYGYKTSRELYLEIYDKNTSNGNNPSNGSSSSSESSNANGSASSGTSTSTTYIIPTNSLTLDYIQYSTIIKDYSSNNGVFQLNTTFVEQERFTIKNDDISLKFNLSNALTGSTTNSYATISKSNKLAIGSAKNTVNGYGSVQIKIGNSNYSYEIEYTSKSASDFTNENNSNFNFYKSLQGNIILNSGKKVAFVITASYENSEYSFNIAMETINIGSNFIVVHDQNINYHKTVFNNCETILSCSINKCNFEQNIIWSN